MLDVILEVTISLSGKRIIFVFQSLFCWMLFWKNTFFNSGILYAVVSILILLDVILEGYWFLLPVPLKQVSILILLDVILEDSTAIPHKHQSIKFQSLFCWMLFWKLASIRPIQRTVCFNPYFVGCYSGSNSKFHDWNPIRIVSILILLDVILEDSQGKQKGISHVVSILILLDVILEAIVDQAYQLRLVVSILILLDVILEERTSTITRIV